MTPDERAYAIIDSLARQGRPLRDDDAGYIRAHLVIAVALERESCAKLADSLVEPSTYDTGAIWRTTAARIIAAKIRRRERSER